VPPRGQQPKAGWTRAWEAALEAGLSVAIAVGVGYWIDTKLETLPLFMFLGLVLGGIAALRRLLRVSAAAIGTPEPIAKPGDAAAGVDRRSEATGTSAPAAQDARPPRDAG
jgi:F0F1-type ATP synthase assembly protein I